MLIFIEWIKRKHIKEGFFDNRDPVANFKINSNHMDYADDQDRVEGDLFKTIMRKYPEETMDFFNTLSQRGDNEVNALLRKIDKGRTPRLGIEPKHPSDNDEIKIPLADAGYSDS